MNLGKMSGLGWGAGVLRQRFHLGQAGVQIPNDFYGQKKRTVSHS